MPAVNPIQAYRKVDRQVEPAGDLSDLNALVERYAPLVKRIAHHLAARLPPSVDVEDLAQSGVIGLIEAARNFDASRGASFETWAGIRIRGAMIDHMRPSDWTPRSVARKSRELAEAIRRVESREGRPAEDSEIMRELDMDSETYHATLRDVSSARLLSFDALQDAGDHGFAEFSAELNTPEDSTASEGFRKALITAIGNLPEREAQVFSLYYDEELNLKEIGQVLGVSESRVCQIQARTVARLRAELSDWIDESRIAKKKQKKS